MSPYAPCVFIAVHPCAKASKGMLAQSLEHLARFGDTVHVATCLAAPRTQSPPQHLEEFKAELRKELGPILKRKAGIRYRFHIFVEQHCGGTSQISKAVAQRLCIEAALLNCRAMALGGTSSAMRDRKAAAVLLGHSTTHCVLKHSTLPVYLPREGRLAAPTQLPLKQWGPSRPHKVRLGLIKAGDSAHEGGCTFRLTPLPASVKRTACRLGSDGDDSAREHGGHQRMRSEQGCSRCQEGGALELMPWLEKDADSWTGKLTALSLAVAHQAHRQAHCEDPIEQWLATAALMSAPGPHAEA